MPNTVDTDLKIRKSANTANPSKTTEAHSHETCQTTAKTRTAAPKEQP